MMRARKGSFHCIDLVGEPPGVRGGVEGLCGPVGRRCGGFGAATLTIPSGFDTTVMAGWLDSSDFAVMSFGDWAGLCGEGAEGAGVL